MGDRKLCDMTSSSYFQRLCWIADWCILIVCIVSYSYKKTLKSKLFSCRNRILLLYRFTVLPQVLQQQFVDAVIRGCALWCGEQPRISVGQIPGNQRGLMSRLWKLGLTFVWQYGDRSCTGAGDAAVGLRAGAAGAAVSNLLGCVCMTYVIRLTLPSQPVASRKGPKSLLHLAVLEGKGGTCHNCQQFMNPSTKTCMFV